MIDLDDLQSELTDSLKPQGELRPLCLQAAQAIADLRNQLGKAADLAEAWTKPSFALMRAGEMTAQELRTVIAVAKNISESIRNLTHPDEEPA